MKKLMLCSILSILFFNAYSQDTSCTYFQGKRVIEFDYYKSEILYEVEQEEKFYEIKLTYGNVLCLDLSDGKLSANAMREVIDIGKNMMSHPVDFIDGVTNILDDLSKSYELVLITKGDLIDQERKIAISDVRKWFKHIEIVSEKRTNTYKNIFSRFGNMNESVMVGNSIKSDAVPAVQAGAWGIHVPYPITWELEVAEPMINHECYFEAKSLSHAAEIIKSI